MAYSHSASLRHSNLGLEGIRLQISSALLERSSKAELSWNTKNAVSRVDVLDQGNLVAGCSSLARDDGRVSEEELPDLEPLDAVLGNNVVAVAQPVSVPSPESRRVVDTDSVNRLGLEAGSLKVVDEKTKRRGGISTWEDVSVHEKTPDEVLVLPGLTKTGDLQEEDSVVIKHLIDLLQKRGKVADTDVLGHLKTGDFVVTPFRNWDITVIHAQNS